MELKALTGEVECLFHEGYIRHQSEVLSALAQHDAKLNHKAGGWLPKSELRACLKQLFEPGGRKSEAQLAGLAAALESDDANSGDGNSLMNYRRLLEEQPVSALPSMLLVATRLLPPL